MLIAKVILQLQVNLPLEDKVYAFTRLTLRYNFCSCLIEFFDQMILHCIVEVLIQKVLFHEIRIKIIHFLEQFHTILFPYILILIAAMRFHLLIYVGEAIAKIIHIILTQTCHCTVIKTFHRSCCKAIM